VESDEEYSGRELCFKPTGELYTLLTEGQRQSREPKVCTGLEVETSPNIDGLDHLKFALSETEVLCYPIEGYIKQISKQYSIGDFGFIYSLLNPEGDTAAITFSHDALYLYCRVQDQQEADGLDIEVNDL
jgi:CRISPR-associated endonuclease/helicase Cas3